MKVKVVSMVPYKVGLIIPELRFARNFTQEGQAILVDEDVLREGMYNRGVENMFKKGVLKIEGNDELKIELGLAMPEEGKVKDTVLTMNSTQMLTLLKVKPFEEFKATLDKLSNDQLDLIVNLAVENKFTDYNKCKLLKEKTSKDIMQIIRLNED